MSRSYKRLFFLIFSIIFTSCDKEESLTANPTNCDAYESCETHLTFKFIDRNLSSPTYCESVGPENWENEIRLFYFSSNET